MSADEDFMPEDYRFTADLLRRYSTRQTRVDSPSLDAMFRAVCSNNLNIILAALDKAGIEEPKP